MTTRFRLLLSGQALSTLGDILYILALVTTLYRQSGSAAVAALFPLLRVIGLAAGGFAAPLVMGRSRRLSILLAGCLFGQTAGLAGLAAYLGAAGSGGMHASVEGLTITVFVLSVMEGIAGPARSSLLPRMVGEEQLLKANGALGAVVEACSLAGWALGAVVVARLGAGPSLWVSALLLLAAAIAAVLMREPAAPAEGVGSGAESAGKSLLAGWRTILRVPALRLVLWMDIWEGVFAASFAGALLLVFAEERLHAGETWWGWMNGAFCLGLIAANAGIGRWLKDAGRRLSALLMTGGAGMALSTLAFSFAGRPDAAVGIMLLMGFAEAAKGLGSRTLLQLASPAREMPSVFAAQSTVISVLFGLSLLLTGWLADRYGIRVIYVGAAAGYFISFLGAFRWRLAVKQAVQTKDVDVST